MNARAIRTSNDIKGMVQPGREVHFARFHAGVLWYATDCGFEFPVAAAETGETPYLARDRAVLFLGFIRKHIKAIEAGLAEMPQDAFGCGRPVC